MLISRGGRESAKLMNKGFLLLFRTYFHDDLYDYLFAHYWIQKVPSEAVFIENALDFWNPQERYK